MGWKLSIQWIRSPPHMFSSTTFSERWNKSLLKLPSQNASYLFTETSHHNFVFCIFIFHLWQFQFWFHQFSPQFFPLFLLIFHYNFLSLISSAQQIVLFMEKIIIDKNLQFLNDITELWNLNGNGVSWREVRSVTFWILPWQLMMMTRECWKSKWRGLLSQTSASCFHLIFWLSIQYFASKNQKWSI